MERAVGQALVACVREHDWREPPPRLVVPAGPEAADRLVEAARYHRVVGCVYHSVARLDGFDTAAKRRLFALYHQARNAHLRVLALLQRVDEVLGKADVPFVVLKGPALAWRAYSRPDLRLYSDLDLLVAPAVFPAALAALEDSGLVVLDRNWPLIRRDVAGEVKLAAEDGTPVDLHWDLFFSDDLRRTFPIPVVNVMARARPLRRDAGAEFLTLDAADTLVHVAVHACLGGGDRLVWLKDLDGCVRYDTPDWDAVVRRSHRWSVHLLVCLMLARARATLGTDVPDDVLRALAPAAPWRGLLHVVDRLSPPQRSTDAGTPATLLARSTRVTAAESLLNVAAGVRARITLLARNGRWERNLDQDDPTNPASLLFPAGGREDRDTYLTMVAAR